MATATARNVASRSIHIKIHPTARSLPERREVLRVLERFGEVEMFKSMKYDPTSPVPNAFLSIMSTESAAQAAIDASPIRYRLITESQSAPATSPPTATPTTPTPATTPPSASSPDPNSPTTTPPPSAEPAPTQTNNQPAPPTRESIFELRIHPSTYPHALAIASSPLHSTYTPISPRRSAIAADLALRIPPSIAKPGLCDWVTDSHSRSGGVGRGILGDEEGLTEGYGTKRVEWGRSAGTDWDGSKPWRLRDREREARRREVPWVMRGLRSRGKDEA